MKMQFRFLSVILSCVMLLSMLPIGSFVSADDTKDDVLLDDFNNAADMSAIIDADDLNRWVDASFDRNIKYSESGMSVKITNKTNTSAKYSRARFKISGITDNKAAGFKVWIKNPSQSGISIAYQLVNKSGKYINMKPNRSYYTLNTAGGVSQHFMKKKVDGANEGCIYIEPEFEGFVYLPVAHGYSSVTADGVSALVLSPYSKANEFVSVYVDELSVYYNVPGENWSIRNFSEYETTAEMKSHMMYISDSVASAITLDVENAACVIDTGSGLKTGNIAFQFAGEPIFNEHTGMRVRMRTGPVADTEILFKWEAASQHRPLKANSPYYLIDTAGNIYAKKASGGSDALITIPAAFDGWLYVPFSSAYPMTYSDIFRLYLNVVMADIPNRSLTVYGISLYKELSAADGAAFVINDFEDYKSTKELKDALTNGNADILDVALENNAWGSRGMKITQVNTQKSASVAVNFGASSAAQNFDGFKIRIKTNKNADLLIKTEDTAHRPMYAKAIYYLASSAGKAYSYRASSDSASLVQLEAGFDGWIYIPFTSFNQVKLSEIYRVWFVPELTNETGTEFLIDDIVLYKGSPQVINDTPIDFKRVLPNRPVNAILDFDDCTSTEEMTKKLKISKATGAKAVLDTETAQNKNSCKFSFADNGGEITAMTEFAKNAYFSEITGFSFWVKASDAAESVKLLYKLETNEHRPVKRGAVYYLADKNGRVISRKASADESALISIPAGYEGWVYIPFSSIYPMNIEELYRIWFIFTASEKASDSVWIDSISCYTDNPVTTNNDIINDFDYYSSTADILLDSVFQTSAQSGSFSIESAYRDGKSGKSLRIKTSGGGYKFIFSSENRNEYNGFMFYIKNASKETARLLPQTDSAGRDSFIPGKAYYTEDIYTGAVEMKRFESVIAEAGNVEIPAGFEGYIYLPYSSAYPSLLKNIDRLNAFWLTVPPKIAANAEVYIDTLAFYKNETCRIKNILVWKQDTPGMLYGFEKSESVAGYRGWISSDDRLDVSIKKGISKSGANSLKVSTPIKTTDGVKNDWAAITLSLKNEDGTSTDVSKYDGIALWLKIERDGTDTKTLSDTVNFGFKVNMPVHGRLYSTSPVYVLSDGDDKTEPMVYTNAPDGCTSVNLTAGFSGMIYIPFSEIKAFSSKEELSAAALTDIFLMFRFYSLIGCNVYIDDIQAFSMKDLKNVQWPGDSDYDPLADPMYYASKEEYIAKGADKSNGEAISGGDEKGNVLFKALYAAVIVFAIGSAAFVITVKIKKSKPSKRNK